MMTITYSLSASSIEKAIKDLEHYKKTMATKQRLLCERLATIGAMKVSLEYSLSAYVPKTHIDVRVEETDRGYKIIASGEDVAFVEFGAGAKHGGGYPGEVPINTNPGSWSLDPSVGKGHYADPNGWYLPRDKAEYPGQKSVGNPPAMGMYLASKEIKENIARIAREVFSE